MLRIWFNAVCANSTQLNVLQSLVYIVAGSRAFSSTGPFPWVFQSSSSSLNLEFPFSPTRIASADSFGVIYELCNVCTFTTLDAFKSRCLNLDKIGAQAAQVLSTRLAPSRWGSIINTLFLMNVSYHSAR